MAEGSNSMLGYCQGLVPHFHLQNPGQTWVCVQTCWIFLTCTTHTVSACTATLTYGRCANSLCSAFKQLYMSIGSRQGAVVSARGDCMAVPQSAWLHIALCQQGTKWRWKSSPDEKELTQEREVILGILWEHFFQELPTICLLPQFIPLLFLMGSYIILCMGSKADCGGHRRAANGYRMQVK